MFVLATWKDYNNTQPYRLTTPIATLLDRAGRDAALAEGSAHSPLLDRAPIWFISDQDSFRRRMKQRLRPRPYVGNIVGHG
jgi:hypothetical protein